MAVVVLGVDDVIGYGGNWRRQQQGYPNTQLAQGHDTRDPHDKGPHKTEHNVNYHLIQELGGKVDVATIIKAPWVNLARERR